MARHYDVPVSFMSASRGSCVDSAGVASQLKIAQWRRYPPIGRAANVVDLEGVN